MPRGNLGRAMESLVSSVVRETVQGISKDLPTQKQVDRMEQRLRELDRRVGRLLKRSKRGKRTGKVGRPRENPLVCRMRNCSSPARAKALCSRHYQQRRRQSMARSRKK